MKSEFQMFLLLVSIGAFSKKINWKGWYGIGLLVFLWMMYSWLTPEKK